MFGLIFIVSCTCTLLCGGSEIRWDVGELTTQETFGGLGRSWSLRLCRWARSWPLAPDGWTTAASKLSRLKRYCRCNYVLCRHQILQVFSFSVYFILIVFHVSGLCLHVRGGPYTGSYPHNLISPFTRVCGWPFCRLLLLKIRCARHSGCIALHTCTLKIILWLRDPNKQRSPLRITIFCLADFLVFWN